MILGIGKKEINHKKKNEILKILKNNKIGLTKIVLRLRQYLVVFIKYFIKTS